MNLLHRPSPLAVLFTALANATRPHTDEPGQLRAGAESPVEPCYLTVLFGGRPTRPRGGRRTT